MRGDSRLPAARMVFLGPGTEIQEMYVQPQQIQKPASLQHCFAVGSFLPASVKGVEPDGRSKRVRRSQHLLPSTVSLWFSNGRCRLKKVAKPSPTPPKHRLHTQLLPLRSCHVVGDVDFCKSVWWLDAWPQRGQLHASLMLWYLLLRRCWKHQALAAGRQEGGAGLWTPSGRHELWFLALNSSCSQHGHETVSSFGFIIVFESYTRNYKSKISFSKVTVGQSA